MPRHVVLVHRYFKPDTPPYAAILARIAMDLAAHGHRVTVLTCQPSYNPAVVRSAPRREQIDRHVRIVRFPVLSDRRSAPLKVINAVWFSVAVLVTVLRLGRVDTVMAASTPPILEGMTGRLAARMKRARLVYHHQDIYPEVAQNLHVGRRSFGRALRAVDAGTDRAADSVVVLSADMRQLVSTRGVPAERIAVLNNFDPWEYDEEVPVDHTAMSKLRILYGGNLGRFQNLEAVFRCLVTLREDPGIEFTFVGDGALAPHLRRLIAEHGLTNVEYQGYEDPKALADRIRNHADLGLVTLQPGVIRAAYPSKVMSYLRNSLPVLALVEPDSELGLDLLRRGAGWVVPPADGIALAALVRDLAGDRESVAMARSAAREMYVDQFSPAAALPRWRALLAGEADTGTESDGRHLL